MTGQTLAGQVEALLAAHEKAIAAVYANTTTPVRDIIEHYDISYNKLYRILRDTETPLRGPQARQIVVLDKDSGDAPTWVPKTPATLALREEQVRQAYYVHQEIVAHICAKFHLSWRTLYRICSPNRRRLRIPGTPDQDALSTLEKKA